MDPALKSAPPDNEQERRVWELLTRDFYWDVPAHHPVQVYSEGDSPPGAVRLQVFEMAVTTILAHLKPEYEWQVSPNRPDSGLDFIGVHRFLEDAELGIAAAITVGGQCKKRTRVDDVCGELAGSLVRMADKISPTFFVVALSARLNRQRVDEACEMLQHQFRRDCHILDRAQIEGLFGDHLETVAEVLDEGLSGPEVEEVLRYFEARRGSALPPTISVAPPPRVLAGVPFRVDVSVRWTRASDPSARIWWRPGGNGTGAADVILVGPIGADGPGGAGLAAVGATGSDPLTASCSIELVTYVVGGVDLGEISIGIEAASVSRAEVVPLGCIDVVETMRPRFFERPYRAGMNRLSSLYEQALTGAVTSVGVVGAGGSGKSRMCEEFALEKRRRGATVVTAKHAKTHEEPHRILGELLAALVIDGRFIGDPADAVIHAIERLDPTLAATAAGVIRSCFGRAESGAADVSEQGIVSALLLLVIALGREAPLIVHLQDLHWCSAEVLSLLERLLRQLSQVRSGGVQEGGILFIFEGRIRESGQVGDDDWSSAPFEAFLIRTDSPTVTCSAFSPDDGLTFARLLFEDRHNARRLLVDDLISLQDELIERIHRAAGSNPFHSLEQVRLLKETGVVGQNLHTGLLYMIRPEPPGSVLPESVFEAIRLRWQYLRDRNPRLALLVWACALIDDQIAAQLFQSLWRRLAPTVSIREIDATDMLWTGDGTADEVTFRHENYFESIRRFTVSEADRRQVVDAYCGWFADLHAPSPAEKFAWARAIMAMPDPDHTHARNLLASALEDSGNSGAPRLARRIRAFLLELIWEVDRRTTLETAEFVRHCDDESDLCRDFLTTDREQATRRIERLHARIVDRLNAVGDQIPAADRDALLLRSLTVEALQAQLFFNDRRPTESAGIAQRVVASVRAQRHSSRVGGDWKSLEMEALYTLSCAQAISGEFASAVRSSADAAAIATLSDSVLARKVLSTYGTILIPDSPSRGESVLRSCLSRWDDDGTSDAALVHVHLAAVLTFQAHHLPPNSDARREKLIEAGERTARVHDSCRRLGLYPDAGAAALVRGVVSAMSGEDDEAAWFAQGVAAAAKGRQMETLWRSHINLATALYRKEGQVSPTGRDHARAALEIMQDTLTIYPEPELAPRFYLLRVGMAAAAWMMLAAGDERGLALLEQFPSLRSHFADPEAGVLAPYDGAARYYQWLRVDDVDYALY